MASGLMAATPWENAMRAQSMKGAQVTERSGSATNGAANWVQSAPGVRPVGELAAAKMGPTKLGGTTMHRRPLARLTSAGSAAGSGAICAVPG